MPAPASGSVVASVCCYCGTGCGVRVATHAGRVVSVTGDPGHPSNRGKLCSKGLALADTVRSDDARILSAAWRPARGLAPTALELDAALDLAADRIAQTIAAHGPDAVGFYLSGQLLTEDYAIFNKLARGLVGTNNIDTNSRLCMSSAVAGYQRTLGADAPPACYDDLEHADTVLIAGSNMAYAHPVLFRRLEAAKAARPDMRVIAVDPRRTDTTALADLHLAITPGSDVALFHAMLNVMIWEDLIDRGYIERHTTGFDAIKSRIHEFTPRAAQDVCGVSAEDIVQAARWFGRAKAALSLYTMGLNQSTSGTAKNAALIHLHLATGQIGRPGTGPFSLTGQPNAMGGREAGGMATSLPGHRNPADPEHRAQVAALWGVASVPAMPGLPAMDMFDAVLDGRIKTLWIAATNPAQSMPDQNRVRAALRAARFVIVQDAYASAETLAYADLILPAATWPEKSGTVTNSERRISRVRAAIAPPGQAQPDWMLVRGVARRLAGLIAPDKQALFDYESEADIFAEHAAMTRGRDLDYSALDYTLLEALGPQQWPYRAASGGTARLYGDAAFATADGRARFMDVGYTPVAEAVSAHFPLRLTTGRLRDQWHTMSRSSLATGLTRHAEEPVISLHSQDMRRQNLAEGALVRVRSKRGALVLAAHADQGLKPGHAFLPMHWGGAFMAGEGINALTQPARDPYSGQPELKHCAVSVLPARLDWQCMGWMRGDPPSLRRQLSHWLEGFDYAVLLPVAAGGGGVRLRLAAARTPGADILARLIDDLGLTHPGAAFDDPSRGVLRRVSVAGDRLTSFVLTGDVRANDALMNWADDGPAPARLAHLLMGRVVSPARTRTICVCAGVSDQKISQAIAAGADLDWIKRELNCGSGCGSCIPEINRMLQAKPPLEMTQ